MTQAESISLQADEHVLHEFRPTWAAYFWPIVLSLGIYTPIAWWLRRGLRYTVTNKRVIKHTGRVSSKTDEFRLADVTRVKTSQSLGEKLLSGGTIVIDTGVDELTLKSVPEHSAVVSSIRSAQTE